MELRDTRTVACGAALAFAYIGRWTESIPEFPSAVSRLQSSVSVSGSRAALAAAAQHIVSESCGEIEGLLSMFNDDVVTTAPAPPRALIRRINSWIMVHPPPPHRTLLCAHAQMSKR